MAKAHLRKPKKKVCAFCKDKITYVDYKDTACCGSSSPTAARSAPAG